MDPVEPPEVPEFPLPAAQNPAAAQDPDSQDGEQPPADGPAKA